MTISSGGKYEHVPLHGYSRRETEKSKLKRLQREADKAEDERERKFKRNLIRNLERKGEGFDLPLRDVETSTGADYNPYRDQRRQAERQRYARLSLDDKESYLESQIRTGTEERGRSELRGEIEALGGEVPFELRDPNRLSRESIRRAGLRGEVPPAIASKKGLERLRDITKGEATELEKERREKAASHRKALDMIKFTELRVVDPEVDNVMHRGDPDKEYVLDTFTEAKRNIEGLLGRTLSAEEEKPLRAIPYPEDGVDEYLENLKEAEERKLEYEKKLAEVKRAPGKEKDTQFQQTQQAKKNALEGYINMGYFPGKDGDIPLKTQQDVFSVAIGMGLDIGNPEIKAWILELPLGTEEIDKPGVFSGTYKKALPSPYKKYKKGTIIKKLNKTWKYLGKGKWEEQ